MAGNAVSVMAVTTSDSKTYRTPEISPRVSKKLSRMEIPENQGKTVFHCPNCKTVIPAQSRAKKKCPFCHGKIETRKYTRTKPLKEKKRVDMGGSLSKRQKEYFMYD